MTKENKLIMQRMVKRVLNQGYSYTITQADRRTVHLKMVSEEYRDVLLKILDGNRIKATPVAKDNVTLIVNLDQLISTFLHAIRF